MLQAIAGLRQDTVDGGGRKNDAYCSNISLGGVTPLVMLWRYYYIVITVY